MSRFWKILVIITCLLSIVAIFISFRINIESISVEGADVVAWSVGILQISIAIIAILFAYNVISFEKRVEKKIQEAENKLKAEFDDAIKKLEDEAVVTIIFMQGHTYSKLGKSLDASYFYLELLRVASTKNMNVLNEDVVTVIKNELNKLKEQEIPATQKEEWLKILYKIDVKNIGIEELISTVKSLNTN